MCPMDRIGIDKIRLGNIICYGKIIMKSINIKEMSENHIEMGYEIDIKSNSCYMCDYNSIIYLIKQKSSLVIEDEILN